jgi:hypothetical protein
MVSVLTLGAACEFDDAVQAPQDASSGSTTSAASSATSSSSATGDMSTTSSTSAGSGGSGDSSSSTSGATGGGGSGGDTSSGGSGGDATAGSGGSGGAGGAGGNADSGQGGTGGGSDDAGAVTTVDDAVAGTGPGQFNYVGVWKSCPNGKCTTATVPELYMQTNHWAGGVEAGTTTDYVTFSFTGTQIYFYGVKDTHYGIGLVSVDGGTEATIDFYAAVRAGDQLMWTSPVMASAPHVFKLRVSGMKNASSTDSTITVDRVDFR